MEPQEAHQTHPFGVRADHVGRHRGNRSGRVPIDHLQSTGRRGRRSAVFSPRSKAAAKRAGLPPPYLPIVSGKVTDDDAPAFGAAPRHPAEAGPGLLPDRNALDDAVGAFGRRARRPLPEILPQPRRAGYDMCGVVRRIANGGSTPTDVADATHEVVIVGGGAAGIASPRASRRGSPISTSPSSSRPTFTIISPAGRWSAAAFSTAATPPAPWRPSSRRAFTGSRRPSPRSSPTRTPSFSMAAASCATAAHRRSRASSSTGRR